MTEELFRNDAYLKTCEAQVVSTGEHGIVLDRTVFYPEGGGQPGDSGRLRGPDGAEVAIADTRKDRASGDIMHVPAEGQVALKTGDRVTAEIDWDRRHRHMRMHTTLHLLCALVEGEITGAQVGAEKSRIDFNLPETTLEKEGLQQALSDLVTGNLAVRAEWISDDELAARPELVRTMSVKPPTGMGKVRVLAIGDVDLQPCGGTHVGATGEIGAVRIGKIENKGRQNRRINVHLEG